MHKRIVRLNLEAYEPRLNPDGEVILHIPAVEGPIFTPQFMQSLGAVMGERKAEKLLDRTYAKLDDEMINALLRKAVKK